MSNVEIYRDSALTAKDVLEFGFDHVAIATGSAWRRDGVARYRLKPCPVANGADVLTPDDVMNGQRPRGKRVTIYDDDHYYMGGVLAELLVTGGHEVTLVTPAPDASNWMRNTMEQFRVQARLLELGVKIVALHGLVSIDAGAVNIACIFTGRRQVIESDSVLLVTSRIPSNALGVELHAMQESWGDNGLKSVNIIGDALAPGTIAAAVFGGRCYAEELETTRDPDAPLFRREVAELVGGPLPWEK
jgi:dimethylamine/trimethylamine dehydrogenase